MDVAVAPLSSVTVRVAVYEPTAVYVFDGPTPVPVVLSPNVHAKLAMVPSASVEPAPDNVSAGPAVPLYGPPARATDPAVAV